EPGPEGLVQALPRDGSPGELVRELQPADRRDDDGLDLVPDLHLDVAVRIRQLRDVDGRLPLPADVDVRDLPSDPHAAPLDRLPPPLDMPKGLGRGYFFGGAPPPLGSAGSRASVAEKVRYRNAKTLGVLLKRIEPMLMFAAFEIGDHLLRQPRTSRKLRLTHF